MAEVNMPRPHPYWGGTVYPIHLAVERESLAEVRDLLDRGADPNPPSSAYDGWTPLHCAIHRGLDEIVSLLIGAGAEVDIHAAAAMGDTGLVRAKLPSMVHARGPNDATPLHFAGSAEVANALLDAGADRHAVDKYGRGPGRAIAEYGRRRVAAAEVVFSRTGERDPFLYCAIGRLIAVGDVNAARVDFDGKTLLHVAASHGHDEIVTMLIGQGAEVDVRANGGITPLHLAAAGGHVGVIKVLLGAGADREALDDEHLATARDWAVFHRREEAASAL
jgi:ankyrin repeat protein